MGIFPYFEEWFLFVLLYFNHEKCPLCSFEVPGLPRTNIDMSSWGRDITWQPLLGKAAMTFYTTLHLLNPSTAQKQHVGAGRKDGCSPISWQVTQFNLIALSIIISILSDRMKKKVFFFYAHCFIFYFCVCLQIRLSLSL